MSNEKHTQEPVAHQFQGRDGEWYEFINRDHYENTVADGTWPIRALYAFPPDAAARIAEAETQKTAALLYATNQEERIAELEAENERDHAAFHRLADRFSNRLAELEKQRDELLAALNEINNWLVCACIATPEDMAQSFQHMQQVADAAIASVKGGAA